jgi:hypothetical protein
LQLDLPRDWQNYDGLVLQVSDNHGNEVYCWVWKIKSHEDMLKPLFQISANQPATAIETDSLITLKANGIAVSFHKNTGKIISLTNDYSAKLSFTNDPVLVSGTASFTEIKHYPENDAQVVEVKYQGDLKKVRWKMNANGWLEMEYEYTLKGKYPFAGISFNYPEGLVLGAKWLGKEPIELGRIVLKVLLIMFTKIYITIRKQEMLLGFTLNLKGIMPTSFGWN